VRRQTLSQPTPLGDESFIMHVMKRNLLPGESNSFFRVYFCKCCLILMGSTICDELIEELPSIKNELVLDGGMHKH